MWTVTNLVQHTQLRKTNQCLVALVVCTTASKKEGDNSSAGATIEALSIQQHCQVHEMRAAVISQNCWPQKTLPGEEFQQTAINNQQRSIIRFN